MRWAALTLVGFAGMLATAAAQEAPRRPTPNPPARDCITIHGDGPDRVVCTDRDSPRSGDAFPKPNVVVGVPPAGGGARDLPQGIATGNRHSYRRAGPPGTLTAVRALILPDEMPPSGVAAYGMVAFPALPLAGDRPRFGFVCDAYLSTLVSTEAARDVPRDQQMITFWPVTAHPEGADDPECGAMIDRYDLKAGLDAIRDADTGRQQFASRRGPFLIAWSPTASRALPDAVILVIDMSNLESAESFQETFKAWRQKIVDDPKFWQNGFSLEAVRLALRDALDTYGARLVPLMPGGGK